MEDKVEFQDTAKKGGFVSFSSNLKNNNKRDSKSDKKYSGNASMRSSSGCDNMQFCSSSSSESDENNQEQQDSGFSFNYIKSAESKM